MGKVLLLNMKDSVIVKEFDTMAEADEAQDRPEFYTFPKHLVDREDWDLPATDMVKFYNNLPGVVPTKRFSDRASGMKRLLAALNGELPVAKVEPINAEEKANVKKTKPTKKTAPKPKKESARKRAATLSADAVLKPTKAGLERNWHAASNRAKLFAWLSKKGEATVGEMLKYGASSLEMVSGAVHAAIAKMCSPASAGGASVKVSG